MQDGKQEEIFHNDFGCVAKTQDNEKYLSFWRMYNLRRLQQWPD